MTESNTTPNLLCLASYFKGERLLRKAHSEGCKVVLLTWEKLLDKPWPRECIDEVFAVPDFDDRQALLNAISYLARERRFQRVIPLDDFDVEVAALAREHLRVPGMGETTARYYRDKLAMREKTRDSGIKVPPFVHTLNHGEVAEYMENVPGPWVLKPRGDAGAIGIKKVYQPEEFWPLLEELGDRQSHHLLEKMIEGDVFHVDAIHWDSKVTFACVSRYRRPLLGIIQGGGIFGTTTLPNDDPMCQRLLPVHQEVLSALQMVRGVTHTEFILGKEDNEFYFLETAGRVGGAHIVEMVEAASGINLWDEWAKVEISQGKFPYAPPEPDWHAAGLLLSLANSEKPDTSGFDDPEIVERLDVPNHIGFILRSPKFERIKQLMDGYEQRIEKDYLTSMPAPDRPTS